jgi:hypothetical protein
VTGKGRRATAAKSLTEREWLEGYSTRDRHPEPPIDPRRRLSSQRRFACPFWVTPAGTSGTRPWSIPGSGRGHRSVSGRFGR